MHVITDNDLDNLLLSTAPPVARRTEELTSVLSEIAHAAETRARRQKRRTGRCLVAAAALTGVIGVGGAATAAGVIPNWAPWTGAHGESCSFSYVVDPADSPLASETQDTPRPVYDDPATLEANHFLSGYEVNAIDRKAVVHAFANRLLAEQASMPADQRPPAPDESSTEFQSQAVSSFVGDQLATHLRAAGFDPDSVTVHDTFRCRQ